MIAAWNAERFLRECIAVALEQPEIMEVIVVDNASSDETSAIAESFKDRVLILRNEKNRGFCSASNQGIKIARGEYILLLNSDVVLRKDYVRELLKCLKRNPRVGMVQGKYLRMDGKTIDSLGLKLSAGKRLYNVADGKKDSPRYNSEREIFGPCAAAAVYRRKVMNDIVCKEEYFDPDFFFLVEDFDIAWRARRWGWKARYVPQAVCLHYRDSSGHDSGYKQFLSFRNRYFLLIKNMTLFSAFLFIPFFLFYDVPRFGYLFITNPFVRKNLRSIIKAIIRLKKKCANFSYEEYNQAAVS